MNGIDERPCSWVAAYTLGALDLDDRRHFEDHLAGCVRCTAELAALAPLPALIGKVDPAEVDHRVDPGRAAAIADEARLQAAGGARSGVRWWLAAAAAAALLVVVSLAVAQRRAPDAGPPFEAAIVSSSQAAETGVALSPRPWGTAITLDIDGLPQRDVYQLWTVDRAGTWTVAATWGSTPTGVARLTGASPTPTTDLQRVVITSADQGDLLVEAHPS